MESDSQLMGIKGSLFLLNGLYTCAMILAHNHFHWNFHCKKNSYQSLDMYHSYRQLPSEVRKWNCAKIFLLLINIFNLVSVFRLNISFWYENRQNDSEFFFHFQFESVGVFILCFKSVDLDSVKMSRTVWLEG